MINQYFNIARLIAKHLSGELSEEEQTLLNNWREKSEENERLFQEIGNEENIKANLSKRRSFRPEKGWEEVNGKIQKYNFRRRFLNVCKYAAILILPITIAAIAIYQEMGDKQYDETLLAAEQILPGSSKAVLTLANGETVDLKSTTGEELKETDGTLIRVDSAALNYQHDKNQTANKTTYNKVSIPRGGEYQLVLSDGSKVHLNSMSSLRFPVRFGSGTRLVELEGEAYFEISKTGQPFIVKTKNMDIEVLGTTFNLSAYAGETHQATLVSGSIKVWTENGGNCIIKPSEQASIAPGSNRIEVRNVDTAFYTSWIHGKINFKDQRLEDIMKTLSRWYDMNIIYGDEAAKDIRFGCYVNRYQEITPLIELLKQTGGVKINIEGKTIKIFTNH